MLFPFPLELFLFSFPLLAQNYSHSPGNPTKMGIPIPMHTSSLDHAAIREGFVSRVTGHDQCDGNDDDDDEDMMFQVHHSRAR